MLAGLRAKYVEMLALRVEHAAGADAPPAVLRRRMAALAAEGQTTTLQTIVSSLGA